MQASTFTQDSSGTLVMQLGGPQAAVNTTGHQDGTYDQLDVTGAASFAGKLQIELYGGFTALVYLTPLVGGLLADGLEYLELDGAPSPSHAPGLLSELGRSNDSELGGPPRPYLEGLPYGSMDPVERETP